MTSGLFDVPTRIIFIVAPINILLNYILGITTSVFRFQDLT